MRTTPSRPAALVSLGLLSWLLAALPSAGQPPEPPAEMTLRVLSYNIHHGEGTDGKVDLDRVAKVLKAARPHLVALQEVDRNTRRSGGVDQTAVLARLTGMHGSFGKAIDFQGGEYGQAVLSTFPIRSVEVHRLPGKTEQESRVAVEARVEIDGRPLTFLSTHLQHDDGPTREKQAAKIVELFARGGGPMILAGDLNALPDSPPLKVLAERWAVATADRKLLTFPSAEPVRQIDYILYRPADRFRVVGSEVIAEKVASDHRPVLAVLELRGR
ncbi:MAG TPA: endonuclease/exonuclease/phosphatase family protein [Gemmataceae bacterium]